MIHYPLDENEGEGSGNESSITDDEHCKMVGILSLKLICFYLSYKIPIKH